MVDQQREAFERDITAGGDLPREIVERDADGDYVNSHSRLAWANFQRGYKAALSHAEGRRSRWPPFGMKRPRLTGSALRIYVGFARSRSAPRYSLAPRPG